MTANDPFSRLPDVPGFALTSTTVAYGDAWPAPQYSAVFGVPGGQDRSPQLSWSGAPEGTRSYVVTVYDPDAPTGSGFWHWVAIDIPASVHDLPENAGTTDGSGLPAGARQIRGDAGVTGFIGAAPPAGHGMHRYFITVSALDVDHLDVPDDATAGAVGFALAGHILARAVLLATAEIPA